MKLQFKRIYDDPAQEDGFRVLIDRIWPRGVSKAEADIDYWAKELAPSTELRRWFDHDPEKWVEFCRRYEAELHENDAEVKALREQIGDREATLLYAARDTAHNNAIVLRDYLQKDS